MDKKILLFVSVVVLFTSVAFISFFIKTTKEDSPAPTTSQNKGSIELFPVEPADDEEKEVSYEVEEASLEIAEQRVLTFAPVEAEVVSLVLYSHGSNEHVEPVVEPEGFVEALPKYGEYFARQGAVFAVSEMYGENWGSREAQEHLLELVAYFEESYSVESVYMFGFSMGGLPALRTARRSPESVDKVALLAPTIEISDWTNTTLSTIEAIPVHIWHGTADVNVPISLSRELVDSATNQGFSNITLEEIPGQTHQHFLEPETVWEFFTKQ